MKAATLKWLAAGAMILNFASMAVWGEYQPTYTYERITARLMKEANRHYRYHRYEKAYAYYHYIFEKYPASTQAEKARLEAAITAVRVLGRFDQGEKELREYLRLYPEGVGKKKYLRSAKKYLEICEARKRLPENVRDWVTWEYVQALWERSHGYYYEALGRCKWIEARYGGSDIGRWAADIDEELTGKLLETII